MMNLLHLLSALKGGGMGMGMGGNFGTYSPLNNLPNFNNAPQNMNGVYNNQNLNGNYPKNTGNFSPTPTMPTPAETGYDSGYPYGQFPTRYTKEGQQQIKDLWKNQAQNAGNVVSQNNNVQYPYGQPPVTAQDPNFGNGPYNNGQYNNVQNGQFGQNFNNGQFGQNNGQHQGLGGGFDINQLLPLLSNFSGGKSGGLDAIKNMLPLLGGGSGLNTNDILKFLNNNIKKSDAPTTPTSISEYKKIDDPK